MGVLISILFMIHGSYVIELESSAYTASHDECWGDPNITSNGESPIPGKTAAVSRDLYEDMVDNHYYVSGHGIVKVNDKTNARYSNLIDLCMSSKREAYSYGRRKIIVIQVPRILIGE